ncbi:MAG: hypothetical protein ABI137_00060 [Antricoccus sp.]
MDIEPDYDASPAIIDSEQAPGNSIVRVEPSWPSISDNGHAVSEFAATRTGALSPFGDDIKFPLPPSALSYEHSTARPAR